MKRLTDSVLWVLYLLVAGPCALAQGGLSIARAGLEVLTKGLFADIDL